MKGGLILAERQVTIDYFSRKMFFRALFPSLISYIGLALGDIADAVVVGQKVGVTGLAAISLALPVYMLINVIMHSFGSGGAIVYARLLGEGKEEEALTNFNGVLRILLLIGLILSVSGNLYLDLLLKLLGISPQDGIVFVVSRQYIRVIVSGIPLFFAAYLFHYYLRSDGHGNSASLGFTVANIVDISLNILFVLVLDFGAIGAALSTVIGQAVAILFYLPVIINRKSLLSFSRKKANLIETLYCFRLGFSSSIHYLFLLLFILSCNNILMDLSGDVGVAVFDVIQNVSFIILYLYDGTAKASQSLIGTYCGERNRDGQKKLLRLTLVCGTLLGAVATLFVAAFPELLCRLFGLTDPHALALGVPALRIYCLATLIAGGNILLESYFQASEKELHAFVLATLRGAVILIPCTWIFAQFGERHIWYLFVATEVLSMGLFLIWLKFREKENDPDEERVLSCTISNTNSDMETLLQEMDRFCEKWNANPKQTYFVRMTLEEICVAILRQLEHNKYGYIQITLIALENDMFELHIRDNATSFNPFELDTEKVSAERYDMEAMGMLVIKSRAKEVFYRQYQGFNTLVVKI